jgi:hypothetical protein
MGVIAIAIDGSARLGECTIFTCLYVYIHPATVIIGVLPLIFQPLLVSVPPVTYTPPPRSAVLPSPLRIKNPPLERKRRGLSIRQPAK